MIGKFLKARDYYKKAKQGVHDPSGLGQDLAKDFLGGYVFLAGLVLLIGVAATGILGFGEALGGPYGFFKFLFFIALFLFVVFVTIVKAIYKLIKKIKKATETNLSKPFDYDVTPEN